MFPCPYSTCQEVGEEGEGIGELQVHGLGVAQVRSMVQGLVKAKVNRLLPLPVNGVVFIT